MYEVIIVGGGPAGLSAALILGRCRRKVLLIDDGKQRNLLSKSMHGFLTQDGIAPQKFLDLAHKDLKKYHTVKTLQQEVLSARKTESGFAVTDVEGETHSCRKLLLATGVIDDIPKFEGIMELYGKSVHTCPYCDAWELSSKPIAVYGSGGRGVKLSLSLRQWSHDIVLLTNGPAELSEEEIKSLKASGIKLNEKVIKRLDGENGQLKKIVFEDQDELPRTALFFNTGSLIRSKLLEQLGCSFSQENGIERYKYDLTNVPGLYVAGNICREVQLVIVAASEGAEAAFGINTALCTEDLPQ